MLDFLFSSCDVLSSYFDARSAKFMLKFAGCIFVVGCAHVATFVLDVHFSARMLRSDTRCFSCTDRCGRE